jgi:VanZ family protein
MRYLWFPFIWALIILGLCGMPGKDIPHVSFLEILAFDKWVHAGIFFVLSLLIMRGLFFGFPEWPKNAVVFFTLLTGIGYGAALELMQAAVFVDRSADLYDFIANAVGAILGVLLYRTFAQRIRFFQKTS